MTDISNRTTLVTLYQAGEGIYELMDKVLVIDEGRMVYQGPAKAAKQYFVDLGYYCPDRQTTADFLTACTDPTERRFRDDFDGPIPKGPIELEKAFRESESYKRVLQGVDEYEKMLQETNHADAREFRQTVAETKSKRVSDNSSYTVSFIRQVLACTQREIWLTLGDRTVCAWLLILLLPKMLLCSPAMFANFYDTKLICYRLSTPSSLLLSRTASSSDLCSMAKVPPLPGHSRGVALCSFRFSSWAGCNFPS